MGLNSRVCRPSESHGLWLVHASSKPGMIESAVGTFSARKPSETPILPSLESLDVNIPWIRVLLNEGCFSFTSWTFPLWRCGILSFGGKIGLRQKKKHHTDSAPPTVDVSESPCQHNHDVTWCCAEGLWSKCKHICSHARPCILWLVNLEYCADPYLHDTSSNRAAAVWSDLLLLPDPTGMRSSEEAELWRPVTTQLDSNLNGILLCGFSRWMWCFCPTVPV